MLGTKGQYNSVITGKRNLITIAIGGDYAKSREKKTNEKACKKCRA